MKARKVYEFKRGNQTVKKTLGLGLKPKELALRFNRHITKNNRTLNGEREFDVVRRADEKGNRLLVHATIGWRLHPEGDLFPITTTIYVTFPDGEVDDRMRSPELVGKVLASNPELSIFTTLGDLADPPEALLKRLREVREECMFRSRGSLTHKFDI